MTHITSQARPRPVHSPTDHPGFATALAWWERHRPALREALDATADEAPLLPSDHFADELDGPGPGLGNAGPVKPRRHTLPCELALILTLARALEAAGGQRPGAPATLSVIHGWGGAVMDQTETLLCNSEITDAFLQPSRDQPHIFTLAPGGASERMQAERRKTLAENISKSLMAGRGAIALGAAPSDLPDELRRLCAHDLRLPRPDPAMIGALLTLLFPGDPEAVEPDLPPGDALARLTPLELTTALHAPTAKGALEVLHRLSAPTANTSPGAVTGLDAVAGQPAAVAVLQRLARDVTAWKAGQLAWASVPRSLIFHGPPGTGKTLMAQAFAAETGLPLIATSFADCQKFGHQGDMLGALETAVAEAETRAPSVFFLDELDGFNSRQSRGSAHNAHYMRGVITGLLRQLDRLMATEGVVLIGATNDLLAIDPAIRRAGRFDTRLLIDPPDRAGLAQILRRHLNAPTDPALDSAITTAAERLVGTNGAEAAALARAALARVREAQGPLAEALPVALLAELDNRLPGLSRPDQRRVALHEAGHVVVGLLSGLPDPIALLLTPVGGEAHWPAALFHTRTTALAELRMTLAGRAAETVFFGAPSSSAGAGPESDLARATQLALRLETEWGMGDGGLIWHPGMPISFQNLPWLRTKLDHLLTTAEAQARAIIATHRDTVEALADTLLGEREIRGEALKFRITGIRALASPPHPATQPGREVNAPVVPLE